MLVCAFQALAKLSKSYKSPVRGCRSVEAYNMIYNTILEVHPYTHPEWGYSMCEYNRKGPICTGSLMGLLYMLMLSSNYWVKEKKT